MNLGIAALMRTDHAEIDHQLDVWHVSKGFSKKLIAGATNEVSLMQWYATFDIMFNPYWQFLSKLINNTVV